MTQEMVQYSSGMSLTLTPLTPNFGAVVHGVDAKSPQDDRVIDGLRDAILEYKVLFLPGQHLSPEEQHRFALNFGEPFSYLARFDPEYDEGGLSSIGVVAHFHADYMYREEGPTFSLLQMLKVPPVGGDTVWVDLVAGYDALSEPIREMIDKLIVIHRHPNYTDDDATLREKHFARHGEELSAKNLAALRREFLPREHPLVRVIPETGRANYWISRQHTKSIKGLTPLESNALLELLFQHQLDARFLLRWKWTPGDIAFWDHRSTLHRGINDYGWEERMGLRASIADNRPAPKCKHLWEGNGSTNSSRAASEVKA